MAARDRVKTMVSRTRSTLDGHYEVNQRRDTQALQALPASGKHKACKPHPSWLTRLSIDMDNAFVCYTLYLQSFFKANRTPSGKKMVWLECRWLECRWTNQLVLHK